MKKTQSQWVMNELTKYGKVTRNKALKNYISRLGAYICDLREAGFKIDSWYIKTKNGKDYQYTLRK